MRVRPNVSGPFVLNGVSYRTQEEMEERVASNERFRVRMARIMARIEAERGELLSWPGDGE
jgi:hypothetical protein